MRSPQRLLQETELGHFSGRLFLLVCSLISPYIMRTTTAFVSHLQLTIKNHNDATRLGLVVRLGSWLKDRDTGSGIS